MDRRINLSDEQAKTILISDCGNSSYFKDFKYYARKITVSSVTKIVIEMTQGQSNCSTINIVNNGANAQSFSENRDRFIFVSKRLMR